ncbi:hypothetical protein [Phycicoccus sp. Soil803]|nr:hypothetical protein [Phycicoccus sp. Soil803]
MPDETTGFVREGVRRDALRLDGEWVDSIVMAVLDHEWATHHGHPVAAG